MDIRAWLYSAVFSCIVIICLEAKTFSLNEAIAAESRHRSEAAVTPNPSERTSERFSLNKVLSLPSTKKRKHKRTGSIFSLLQRKRLSPFRYRKTFEIKSPLKPRKLKRSPKLRNKRKNYVSENEVDDAILDQKYIPLLKTIGMLFDNLLGTDESSSEESRARKYKRNRYRTLFIENDSGNGCDCQKTDSEIESESNEATNTIETLTTTSASPDEFQIAEITSATTDSSAIGDVSGIGHNTDLPLLFPRNSYSHQRNGIGVSERSSPTRDWSSERHFAWNNGNNEHDTKFKEDGSIAKDDDKIAVSTPRNSSGGNGPTFREWGIGNIRGTPTSRDSTDSEDYENPTNEINRENGREFKEENQLEVGRDETESSKSVPKYIRRLRGSISKAETATVTNSLRSEENDEREQLNSTSHKRILGGNGENTAQNQKVRSRNETVMLVKTPTYKHIDTISTSKPSNKSSIVMIIDGYSVTRHKNGENKLSNESIHIHS